MNTTPESRLLELYDRVAEAPDAIERLRKFVLDLAVRGKLVEQDPEDEPAEALLERIATEEGTARKDRSNQKTTGSFVTRPRGHRTIPRQWMGSGHNLANRLISPRNDLPTASMPSLCQRQ